MKPRKPLPRRKAYIARGAPPRKLNVPASLKRQARRQEERTSASWKALRKQVRERSGGRCEREEFVGSMYGSGEPWPVYRRCPCAAVDVHHLRYTKVRAREALTDLLHVCKGCHAALEAEHPHRAARRQALSRAEKGA